MNILHLKYAVSVAEYGSINKAAEEIHVAQPNLSRVIKGLEADLNIEIFRRSPRGMELTPDGELFIAQLYIGRVYSFFGHAGAGRRRDLLPGDERADGDQKHPGSRV